MLVGSARADGARCAGWSGLAACMPGLDT